MQGFKVIILRLSVRAGDPWTLKPCVHGSQRSDDRAAVAAAAMQALKDALLEIKGTCR